MVDSSPLCCRVMDNRIEMVHDLRACSLCSVVFWSEEVLSGKGATALMTPLITKHTFSYLVNTTSHIT